MEQQRKLFRHGFIILTAAFVLGAVAGGAGGGPQARLWLGAHTTGILVGLLVVAVGAVWPRLMLGPGAARALYFVTLVGNWVGLIVLGVFAPLVSFRSAINTPSLPPPAAWANAIVVGALVVVSVCTFASCGLVIFGLKPTSEPRA